MMSGVTPERLRGKGFAEASEARDHFVENQEYSVAVADLTETLQVALWRN